MTVEPPQGFDAVCERCGEPFMYDSDIYLCPKCVKETAVTEPAVSPLDPRLAAQLKRKLKEKTWTVEELEAHHQFDTSGMSNVKGEGKGWGFFEKYPQFVPGDVVTFGWLHDQWNEFKKLIQPGDVIQDYNDIEFLSGTAGYALVRNGEVFDYFPTSMS